MSAYGLFGADEGASPDDHERTGRQHREDALVPRRKRQQPNAIANLCGYASQNATCRFFRLKEGMTMTQWRQRHLGPRQ